MVPLRFVKSPMRVFIIFFILLTSNNILFAQDILPRLTVVNISNHILISWTNPYYNLTTINIQRSFDSIRNFRTIGTILDVKNKVNGNYDHFYVKVADASRIYGLELEHLLTHNPINFLYYQNTLIEEHIDGIPGDVFLQQAKQLSTAEKIDIAGGFCTIQ